MNVSRAVLSGVGGRERDRCGTVKSNVPGEARWILVAQ
jgi:hypothetical protein